MLTVEECIEIYKGDYSPIQQYAASILLKMLLKEKYQETMDGIKESLGFKINNRNSSRVRTWKNKIK